MLGWGERWEKGPFPHEPPKSSEGWVWSLSEEGLGLSRCWGAPQWKSCQHQPRTFAAGEQGFCTTSERGRR